MNAEKPNINVSLRKTLLIILGIVVAFLLSFGSRFIALNPQDINAPKNVATQQDSAKEPAITWKMPEMAAKELTSVFLSKLSELK